MIGALSEAVTVPVTTAVSGPTVRIHPAIIAQAAATAAVDEPARYREAVHTVGVAGLGSGSGSSTSCVPAVPGSGAGPGHALEYLVDGIATWRGCEWSRCYDN